MVCFVSATGYIGGRQSPSVLFLSASFLSTPRPFHRLCHCPSPSLPPQSALCQSPTIWLFFFSLTLSHSTIDVFRVEPTLSGPCMNSSIGASTWVLFNKLMLWVHVKSSVLIRLQRCSCWCDQSSTLPSLTISVDQQDNSKIPLCLVHIWILLIMLAFYLLINSHGWLCRLYLHAQKHMYAQT